MQRKKMQILRVIKPFTKGQTMRQHTRKKKKEIEPIRADWKNGVDDYRAGIKKENQSPLYYHAWEQAKNIDGIPIYQMTDKQYSRVEKDLKIIKMYNAGVKIKEITKTLNVNKTYVGGRIHDIKKNPKYFAYLEAEAEK